MCARFILRLLTLLTAVENIDRFFNLIAQGGYWKSPVSLSLATSA